MNAEQALLRLGASTSEAVQGVLQMFSPDGVVPGAVRVVPPEQSPFADATFPAIAADVSYVDGVTGGNVMVIGLEGARRLAAAMMGMDPMSVEAGGELSELEFSAVGEAMNQMMSAAAMATSKVLDEEVEIAPPDVRQLADANEGGDRWEHPGHATAVTFSFCGAPCLLVQLVPNAFIVRMTRALDEMTESHDDAPLGDALRDISVRVWAELGRTRMPSGRIVALPTGAVVELDRAVEAPIDLYADGMRFATGRLVIADDGGLAVRVETILGASSPASTHSPEPTPTEVSV
ncbi:MAG TPA: FliM/FliN family flagellar motor switch protein [Baekduia sp.]|uniref:FliM/FliN family flagellar motor switch protein n=1 Tax=Baekduia sp. TaxID=2600305 RepID=UPI002D78C711|nr:FliM/FliN family flagellar motor switch protein [Baekduia sp.]HET6508876.1 FliM/FliN family flagellar motor switch protein [Baekduia sp.]